ncbi:MAG: hypothetical protein AAF560_02570 [Acidobacteriota bacterium]
MKPEHRQLMRLLHGELAPEEATRLEARMQSDPQLRQAYEQLAATWGRLELPRPESVPADFADAVRERARHELDEGATWSTAPSWVRAGAGLALTAGMALGLVLEARLAPQVSKDAGLTLAERSELYAELDTLSLAEDYWLALDNEALFSNEALSSNGALSSTDTPQGEAAASPAKGTRP